MSVQGGSNQGSDLNASPPARGRLTSNLVNAGLAMMATVFAVSVLLQFGWLAGSPVVRWYSIPAELLPQTARQQAVHALCEVVAIRETLDGRGTCEPVDAPTVRSDLVCFGVGMDKWCFEPNATVATALWLTLSFGLMFIPTLRRRRRQALSTFRILSAAQRFDQWRDVILTGGAGLSFLGFIYFAFNASKFFPVSGQRCVLGVVPCIRNLADPGPVMVLMLFFAGMKLISAITGAYRLRHDFFQKYESKDAQRAGQ